MRPRTSSAVKVMGTPGFVRFFGLFSFFFSNKWDIYDQVRVFNDRGRIGKENSKQLGGHCNSSEI